MYPKHLHRTATYIIIQDLLEFHNHIAWQLQTHSRFLNRQWKQGQVTWEEYRDTVWLCSDGFREAKAQLKLNLARDTKNDKKGFYRYVSHKSKVKESVPPTDEQDWQTGNNREKKKDELFNNVLASIFTGNLSSQSS